MFNTSISFVQYNKKNCPPKLIEQLWNNIQQQLLNHQNTSLFADVLWAFIPAHQRLLYGVWNSFPHCLVINQS